MGAAGIFVPLMIGIVLAVTTMVARLPLMGNSSPAIRTARSVLSAPSEPPIPLRATSVAPASRPAAGNSTDQEPTLESPRGSSGSSVVDVAISQLGLRESPYGSDGGSGVYAYTAGRNEPWCADFISWVYKGAGQPFTGGSRLDWQIPAVRDMRQWLKQNGHWQYRTAAGVPKAGDVVVFSWSGGYGNDHAGIVERVEGTTLHTIEGNTINNQVERVRYEDYKNNRVVVGWGRPR